jgi:glucose/arabinose dehydrogenase
MRVPLVAAVLVTLLVGCSAPTPVTKPSPSPTATAPEPTGVQPVGEPTVIATGLNAPWSLVRLATGSTLISERDTALVRELTPNAELRDVATIPGVVPNGEAGLLGLEVIEVEGVTFLYAYFTAERDNRVVRFPLVGAAGNYSLGDGTVILSGLVKAGNHDGGRIKLGPDGYLYVTVGDAADSGRAQRVEDLNGKILRIDVDGSIPADNPFPGSPVYSYGHRNPQGLAWDGDGQLWAAEFGQDTWDELNRIEPGGNYGWPLVEGLSDDPAFVDPVYEWPTDAASPSGLAWIDGTFFLAALRGERLWAIDVADTGATATEWFTGTYGRLRDVIAGPDGSLWMVTNNTDGRGDPRDGDDRILEVRLEPLANPSTSSGQR